MTTETCNIFSLEDNERIIPDGIANFLFSDAKGMPLFPPEHYTPNPDVPFFFTGLLMAVCVQGEAEVSINFKKHTLKAGSTLMVLPSLVCRFEHQSSDFMLEGFFFSFDFFAGVVLPSDFKALFQIGLCPCREITKADMAILRNHYRSIVEAYQHVELAYRVHIIRGLLFAMLLFIVSRYKGDAGVAYAGTLTRQEELTARFAALLSIYYKSERRVSFYAGKLCVSSKYLSQVTRIATGRSAMQWINSRIITEAKLLLRTTSMSVLQVSEELNFPNPSFFGQFFRKHTGITPYKFRRS
ncbi:MAG: helix-turn-helix transcriptional regulator [Prevotellaceae bacterium]|jgi:AraC-like DNA-binding protein|nr:helix-turn-helix transcriptional regulator [Prevotellaceae bacterium]